jgi:acetyl-CoA acetyltransferase
MKMKMKTNITHNTVQELILQTLNDPKLMDTLQQSFEEYDLGIMKRAIADAFSYTAEQMTAFEAEWKLMYNDWFWENVPCE